MRILHVVLEPRHSGAEILVAKLALQHRKQAIPVAVSALEPIEPGFIPVIRDQALEGVKWFAPHASGSRLSRLLALRTAISEFRPTAVFAHSAIPSIYARAVTRLPVFSVLHAEDDYKSPALLRVEKILHKRARCVICVSESARQNYVRRLGVATATVLENGIELGAFEHASDTPATLLDELRLPQTARIILQVGRITALKNQLASLNAFARLSREVPEIHLAFAGLVENREYQSTLETVAASANMRHRVHFLGPRSDVPHLMCAASLILMPSAREAHSIAFLEAMASQRNIVASDIPSFAFASNDPGVSLLKDPHDVNSYASEMRRFLTDNGLRRLRDMSRFNIETTARRYEELARLVS